MTHVFDAIYEGGVLKPDRPLPLADREKVRVTIESIPEPVDHLDAVRQMYGIVRWTGGAESLERLAMDPDFDVLESP